MNAEIQFLLPLFLITSVAIIALVIDSLSGKSNKFMVVFSLLGLSAVFIASAYTLTLPVESINSISKDMLITKGMVAFGSYSSYFDMLFSLAGILVIFAARPYLIKEDFEYREFYSLLIFAVSGMMLIAHTANLLILFIGIEVMSIPFYVLAGYFRKNTKSVESALKYFLLGAFATGFLLYGIAMIYGATGSMDLVLISTSISEGNADVFYLTVGISLLIVGLSFKVAAFPFHQWAPDVYHGAPTVVTAFMSTAGKAAAIIGFVIVSKHIFIQSELIPIDFANNAKIVIAMISAATMLVGNITALVQQNIKRMLAYSSVAHAGYLLMGVVAANETGWSGIVFYATAYMFMQIGAFVIVSIIEKNKEENLELDDYKGLNKKYPVLAALMSIFMLSLAGIPPFAGFFGKYYLFRAAVEADYTWLTIVAVISSIISIYFYIGLIVKMYFQDSEEEKIEAKTGIAGITLAITTIAIVVIGILPSLVMDLASKFF